MTFNVGSCGEFLRIARHPICPTVALIHAHIVDLERARELQLVNPACTEAQAKDWEATRSGSDCNWGDYKTLRSAALDVARAALEQPAPGLEVSSIETYVKQN